MVVCVCVCVRVCVGDFLFLFNLCDTAFEFKRTLFIIRRINKSLKFLGHSLRLELNLLLKLLLEMRDALTKKKTFQVKNRLVRLADTPVANLIKAKSTE